MKRLETEKRGEKNKAKQNVVEEQGNFTHGDIKD